MLQVTEPTRLAGCTRISVDDDGKGWLHLTWTSGESALQVHRSEAGVRLVLTRQIALALVGILHIHVEALRQLGALSTRGEPSEAEAERDVRVASTAKNQVLEISWTSPADGANGEADLELLSVDAATADLLALRLTAELARVALPD